MSNALAPADAAPLPAERFANPLKQVSGLLSPQDILELNDWLEQEPASAP